MQTRCIVKGEAQKSPLFWRFSGAFWFSQDRLFCRNSTRKPLNLIKSPIFTNAPCKNACLYNAPSMHTLDKREEKRINRKRPNHFARWLLLVCPPPNLERCRTPDLENSWQNGRKRSRLGPEGCARCRENARKTTGMTWGPNFIHPHPPPLKISF